jgi:hypothetical protein
MKNESRYIPKVEWLTVGFARIGKEAAFKSVTRRKWCATWNGLTEEFGSQEKAIHFASTGEYRP